MRTTIAGWLLGVVVAAVAGVVLAAPASAQPSPSEPPPTIPLPPPTDPCATPVPGQPRPPYCLPTPTTTPTAPTVGPTVPPPGQDPDQDEDEDKPGGVTGWIIDGIDHAITWFFRKLVTAGLRPTLDLVGHSLLATPTLDQLPRIGELWQSSRLLVVAVYGVLVMIGGLIVMAHESIQTRYSIKEILPRLVVAFLVANMSLVVIDQAIRIANAFSAELLGADIDPDIAAKTMGDVVLGSINGLWMIFLAIVIQTAASALIVGWVIRVAATVLLTIGAPFALACHALPQTDPIARWWWRAFVAMLGIQGLQSFTLGAAVRVFFAEGGFRFFGPVGDGLMNLLVTFALLYILCRIPFWLWQHVQVGGGRSMIGGLIKAFLAYKTFGLIRGRGGHRATGRRPGGPSPTPAPPGPKPTPLPSWSFPRRPRGGPSSGGEAGPSPRPTRPRPTGPRPQSSGTKPTQPAPDDTASRPATGHPGAPRRPHLVIERPAHPRSRPPGAPATRLTTRPAANRPPGRPAGASPRVRPLPPDLRHPPTTPRPRRPTNSRTE